MSINKRMDNENVYTQIHYVCVHIHIYMSYYTCMCECVQACTCARAHTQSGPKDTQDKAHLGPVAPPSTSHPILQPSLHIPFLSFSFLYKSAILAMCSVGPWLLMLVPLFFLLLASLPVSLFSLVSTLPDAILFLIHSCVWYSAKKKTEIMSFAKKWMNLEIIMLNKM